MEKTRDLVKKLEIPRDNFMQRWLDKERNSMDLTEAEDIKKWQEFTQELYQKDLHDPDNYDDVITHLVSEIPECEVNWALASLRIN